MLLWNLLAEEPKSDPLVFVLWGAVAVAFILMMVFNRRSQKKRQEEVQKTLDAVKPGCTVKTIGGICGTVVEVDETTFVLETGSEKGGKSYVKFDKQAIYQTNAVAEKTEEVKEEKTQE